MLIEAARAEGLTTHEEATYVCMEGPAFSTRAESELHRSWGAHLIGMTAMPEARLAREAEMCYASICQPTDYDVWRDQDVDVPEVLEILRRNEANVKRVLARAVPAIPLERARECEAWGALEYAIMTAPEAIPEQAQRDYELVLGRYLSSET